MKFKFFPLILLLISNVFFSQHKKFVYEYRFLPDSLNAGNIQSEYMILNVDKYGSQFFSEAKYKSDSTLWADSKKGIISMPVSRKLIHDRVIKSFSTKEITFITFVSNACYQVKEPLNFNWQILPEYDEVFGYKVQKAVTNYRGRTWIAYFCNAIPISDGPYKFKGLPGLILKIQDVTKSHTFEIKGIENVITNFQYPELNNYSNKVNVDYKQYKRIYKNYIQNPVADLIGKIPDFVDSEGNTVSGQQKVREIEEYRKKEIKKNNNILELELLK